MGGKGRGEDVQANDAKDDGDDVEAEDIGYAEGEAEDHGQDAEPGVGWVWLATAVYSQRCFPCCRVD